MQDFNRLLRAAGQELGITSLVAYEARHSGASNDRLHDRRDLLAVQKRGRWKTTRSLVRYEKHTRMLQLWASLPLAVRSHCSMCEQHLAAFVLGGKAAPHPPRL